MDYDTVIRDGAGAGGTGAGPVTGDRIAAVGVLPGSGREAGVPAVATRWFHGWNVVGATMVCQGLVAGAAVYSLTFLLVPLSKEFGAGKGKVMLAFTFLSLMMAVLSPFVGRAADRLPARLLMTSGVIATFVGLVLAALAQSLWMFYVVFAVAMPIGVTCAGTMPSQALVARWFNRRRGLALGLSAMGISLGGAIFPPVVTTLLSITDWRTAYLLIAAGVAVIALPVVLLLVREPSLGYSESGPAGKVDQSVVDARTTQRLWSTAEVLKNRDYWVLVVWVAPMVLTPLSIQLNLAPIGQGLGFAPATVAFVASVFFVALMIGQIIWGALIDRINHRHAIWLSTAMVFVPLSVMAFTTHVAIFTVLIFLIGVGSGSMLPLTSAIIASRFGPTAVGSVTGLLAPIFLIASFGPPGAGMISDATGSYSLVYIAGAALLVPAFALTYFLSPILKSTVVDNTT